MDKVTENVSRYVKEKGINVAKMARGTGIPYMALYDSLLNEGRDREIKGKELLAVCDFLGVNPMDFMDKTKTE